MKSKQGIKHIIYKSQLFEFQLSWFYWRQRFTISCKIKLKHCDTEKTVNKVVSTGTHRQWHNFVSCFDIDGRIVVEFTVVIGFTLFRKIATIGKSWRVRERSEKK